MDSDPGSISCDYHLCCWTRFSCSTPSLEGLDYDYLLATGKWKAPEAGARRA